MPTQSCMARRESHVLLLMRVLLLLLLRCTHSYPKGYAAPSVVPCQCNMRRSPSKLKRALPQSKIDVTSKSPVGDISVVTLIRTDTTLDHSQKAEKVWFSSVPGLLSLRIKFASDCLLAVMPCSWQPPSLQQISHRLPSLMLHTKLEPWSSAKIGEVTLMRPIHGNL